jgi:peptidoglycan/LPS O-acetylase OafA/YrhL
VSLSTWPRGAPVEHERQTASAAPGRRTDLDWIRVSAFGLLILYHVALVYGPFDWHIRSSHTFGWLPQGLLITQPWRLTLLFLVSGAALRFMTRARTAGSVLKARAARLLPPLAFGVVALVPVQAWIEATDKGRWTGGFLAWMVREFSPAGLRDGVPVNHLWFVLFICAYTAVAVPLLARPAWTQALERGLEWTLSGWRLLALPALYLIVARAVLYYWFGLTNDLIGDWYNHAQSLAAFLFGFLAAGREAVWRDFERLRWVSLGLCATALPLAIIQSAHPGGGAFHEIPRNAVYALDQWTTISAILGFGSRHLRGATTPLLSYLNQAVFPCYLAHQSVLVIAVWLIRPAGLPAGVEALALVAVTFTASLAIYEVVRRIPAFRPLWGLKPQARAAILPRPNAAPPRQAGFR